MKDNEEAKEREAFEAPQNFCQQCGKTVHWSPCVTDGEAINCVIAAQARASLRASTQPADKRCHNCDGLGYRREANGEQIPCDLCDDLKGQD